METLVRNTSDRQKVLDLTTEIYNPNGKLINSHTSKITIENNKENNITQSFEIKNPDLWSTETPRMYKAISKLFENNKIIDEYQTPFGIRSIEFTNRQGLLVNGKRSLLKE
jgi:beta-galactosidase